MTEKDVQLLLGKLDGIIKLMVFSLGEGKPQAEKIRLLSSVGFRPTDIARTLGTTPNTVRVALSSLQKQGAIQRRAKRHQEG